MILQGLLVYIACIVLFYLQYLLGNILVDRPLIVGTVVGLLLGDVKTGIIAGGTYELIFLGAINAGGVVPSNPTIGTAIGVSLAILSGMDINESLAVAVPAGLLGGALQTLMYTVRAMFNNRVDKMIDEDNEHGIVVFTYVQSVIWYALLFLPVFLVVAFGQDSITGIVNSLPEVVTHGLSVAGGFLPAVGVAILMNMTWSKELGVYFFVGYVLSAYLGMPMVGIAIAAILYVIILFYNYQGSKKAAPAVEKTDGEEELFND